MSSSPHRADLFVVDSRRRRYWRVKLSGDMLLTICPSERARSSYFGASASLALMFIEVVPDPLDCVFERFARHQIGREFPTADAASGCNAWNLNVEVLKVQIPSRPHSRPPQSRPISCAVAVRPSRSRVSRSPRGRYRLRRFEQARASHEATLQQQCRQSVS